MHIYRDYYSILIKLEEKNQIIFNFEFLDKCLGQQLAKPYDMIHMCQIPCFTKDMLHCYAKLSVSVVHFCHQILWCPRKDSANNNQKEMVSHAQCSVIAGYQDMFLPSLFLNRFLQRFNMLKVFNS